MFLTCFTFILCCFFSCTEE